ncbi:MAG: hypothetical protein A2048_09690 [Deltaproteobacteria bacterium GWA2_45_12]|nr:MAG: hypothetical protein A2048_09690 [Deltaproteobacteria bacterium GWA2_45_12]
MPPIHLLEDHLINKIAAGEVVERPASAVKELVENSLDAGATQIDVELKDGGKKLILVRDNGVGISKDELKLALARHSTSKISTENDLYAISSFGFRGEALASMASVSKLTLTSRVEPEFAHEIGCEGGQFSERKEAPHPQGTTVALRFLFYNTPARLKFLKSADTELAHIHDILISMALANPQVGFSLTCDQKKIFYVKSGSHFKERIFELFGKETEQYCYPFQIGHSGLEAVGYAGHPQISRSHNKNMYFFVNNRPVKDKVLHHATMEAYRDLLMKGRYPFSIVFLKIPSEMVDVNVHPAKTEVRFSQSQVIHRLVYEAVRKILEAAPWNQAMDGARHAPTHDTVGAPLAAPPSLPFQFQSESDVFRGAASSAPTEIRPTHQSPEGNISQKQIQFGQTPYASMEVLGQFWGTYILCQSDDKLILIDQHAAHERIGFEKLLLQYKEGEIPSQHLLIPENFDLNPSQTAIVGPYLDDFKKMGLEVDFFGGNTFVVKSKPALFKKLDVKSLLLDLVGDVLEKGKLTSLIDQLHAVLARMSCHGAIRAHHLLTLEEMKAMVRELDQYHFTSFCPHGRPVSVEVTRYEIEKWFKRIV